MVYSIYYRIFLYFFYFILTTDSVNLLEYNKELYNKKVEQKFVEHNGCSLVKTMINKYPVKAWQRINNNPKYNILVKRICKNLMDE